MVVGKERKKRNYKKTWPAHQYPKHRLKIVSVDDLKEDLDDEESNIDDCSKSEFDKMDIEDEYLDKYLISSCHEDTLMDNFVDWLETDDGHFFGGWMNNILCDGKDQGQLKHILDLYAFFFLKKYYQEQY